MSRSSTSVSRSRIASSSATASTTPSSTATSRTSPSLVREIVDCRLLIADCMADSINHQSEICNLQSAIASADGFLHLLCECASFCEHGVAVERPHVPLVHQHLAVDDCRLHVVSARRVNQMRH